MKSCRAQQVLEDEQRGEGSSGAGSSNDVLMHFAGPDRGIIPGSVSGLVTPQVISEEINKTLNTDTRN